MFGFDRDREGTSRRDAKIDRVDWYDRLLDRQRIGLSFVRKLTPLGSMRHRCDFHEDLNEGSSFTTSYKRMEAGKDHHSKGEDRIIPYMYDLQQKILFLHLWVGRTIA